MEDADHDIEGYAHIHKDNVSFIPHAIRKIQDGSPGAPLILSENLERLFSEPPQPTPQEKADNLIKWIGQNQPDPGIDLKIRSMNIRAIIGSTSDDSLVFVFESLKAEGLVTGSMMGELLVIADDNYSSAFARDGDLFCCLSRTFKGWDRYEELRRGSPSGTTVFMAMQFNDEVLDRIVDECFCPAVAATSYEFRKINDPQCQRAGLIDDRLRVKIKVARFMICGLTHNNNGAYWEVGYAEGFGKPFIYTCEKSFFDQRVKEGGARISTLGRKLINGLPQTS